ncbi:MULTISPECIES: NUDIX hydrolase [Lysinibacillus]|uniref:NUDIX domain-containing protein n=1 Tax=Lysinibacillus antri TaxID=2498145 RepID=A0A3S0R605_9BACI|nr:MULTISPECIES: NUDIX hydrolase [Lysinibacillus]RUL52014.1 NUDIX domain-containing protein [Lysinibacillus antri]TSI05947.1 NUDIX hydrolase [Lysinibacillus sp. BW-2-10]
MEYYQYLRQFVGTNPLILPGSVVIIGNEKGEVLLQKRPERRWGLPGGLMNLGESFEEVAEREVFEETGLELRNLTLLHVYSGKEFYTKAANGDEYYNITAVFMTKEVVGNLQLDEQETVALQYFHCEDLPEQMIGSHYNFIQQFKGKLFNM